jgi:hypothetical protein
LFFTAHRCGEQRGEKSLVAAVFTGLQIVLTAAAAAAVTGRHFFSAALNEQSKSAGSKCATLQINDLNKMAMMSPFLSPATLAPLWTGW